MNGLFLSPKIGENISKCNSLKNMGSQQSKIELKPNNYNYINNYFKLPESKTFNSKIIPKKENRRKKNLIKTNNNIYNIISNCMEKIRDEKTQSTKTQPLAELIETQNILNEQKKNIKNHISSKINNFQRKKTQKSTLKKNKTNVKNQSSHRYISKYLLTENNGSNRYKRIRTTSRLHNDKEKEIVYNITTSLISLCNTIRKYSISTDKKRYRNSNQSKYNSSLFRFNKKCNLKRNSKDEHRLSSFSIDSKAIKNNSRQSKFDTFIQTNTNSNKYKRVKFRDSSKSNKNLMDFIHQNNNDKSFTTKRKKTRKGTFSLDWNNLKNRENLTEREYVNIGEDLRQTIIGYNKKELENEIENIENTEILTLVKRLPTLENAKNNSDSKKKKLHLNVSVSNSCSKYSKYSNKSDKEKFRTLQHSGYVYDSLDDEEVEDAIDINYYYIKPDSIFIYFFDSLIAILSFYCLFYLPFYLAYDSFTDLSYFSFKIFVFHLVEVFYIIDLIIGFFRSYYNYDEILIKNIFDMSYNYINNWFFLDLLSAIPFYSIIFVIERRNGLQSLSTYPYKTHLSNFSVKINKLHYLLVMNKLIKVFKCFSESNRMISQIKYILFKNDRVEEKSGIFFATFAMLAASNFGTSIFIFIGRNSYPSWINAINIENEPFTKIYICSLYYLITTITTVGYGDIYGRTLKEILLQIILLMIGTCTYSYLISLVSNYIKKESEKSLMFENKLKILNEIKLTNPHLQNHLYDKILRFLRYKKNEEKNKHNIIINSLPYSLKNSLIIEMYKPIINNFIIFKGLENSNCIVQLVTAFKPIYAIRNDVLIQEGDFIEEVIFIKTGIISLEISIDLNNPKESILNYLNKKYVKEKSINRTCNETLNSTYSHCTTSFLMNRTTNKTKKIGNNNRHFLKVLDIRKNEHFGETLMFLNERSPLTAKVKSKKAELFFLKKEEIIKIFNSFPNIWNRINKRSIYNMKQIKMTVRKVLFNFCSVAGINLYPDIYKEEKKKNDGNSSLRKSNINKVKNAKKDITKQDETNKVKNNENNNVKKNKEIDLTISLNQNSQFQNSEFYFSIIKSENSINKEKNSYNSDTDNSKNLLDKIKNNEDINKKNTLKSFSNGETAKISNLFLSNFSKDNSIKIYANQKSTQNSGNNSNNNNLINNTKEINELKNKNKNKSHFSCFKEMCTDRSSPNNTDKNTKQENKKIFSKDTIKVPNEKKVCQLIDSESIEEDNNNESFFKDEDYGINDEIYKNESFNLNCQGKDDLFNKKEIIKSYLNSNITIQNLSRKILEKTWVNNLENEKLNYLDKLLNKSKDNISYKNSNNYSSMISGAFGVASVEAFQIQSAYENINDITCNKYIKNNILRKRTKEFLLKGYEEQKKISESKMSSDSKYFRNLIFENNNNIIINGIDKKNRSYINENEVIQKNNLKKASSPNLQYKFGNSSTGKNMYSDRKKQGLNSSQQNSCNKTDITFKHYSNRYLPRLKRSKFNNKLSAKNIGREKFNRSFRLNNENEMSFYEKYNMSNKIKYDTFEEYQSPKRKRKQNSELEEIKNNIKQDAQNLIQPALYYQQLFFNHFQKRKEYNKTFLSPINKNSNIKVRRTATSSQFNPINHLNQSLGITSKKNNLKSCVNIRTKFKNN